MRTILAIGLLLVSGVAAPAEDDRISVYISHSGEDSIGKQILYRVEEELRRSALMRLTDSPMFTTLYVSLVTMDDGGDDTSDVSVYSISFSGFDLRALNHTFINSAVGIVGRDRVQSVAGTVVADIARYAKRAQEAGMAARKAGCNPLLKEQ